MRTAALHHTTLVERTGCSRRDRSPRPLPVSSVRVNRLEERPAPVSPSGRIGFYTLVIAVGG